MTTVELAKHSDIDTKVECDGPLISTYISNTKCGKCGKSLGAQALMDAGERIEDHQTFYGLALVKVDESEDW